MDSTSEAPRRKKIDPQEFEIPETHYVRDIEDRVFQGIVLQCLSDIEGITLVEGNFIDNILGRDSLEGIRGIHAEQDSKHQTVAIQVEINITYGVSIPEKANEIQSKITEEITRLTGLHVASVHVVFKNIVSQDRMQKISDLLARGSNSPVLIGSEDIEEEYSDEF